MTTKRIPALALAFLVGACTMQTPTLHNPRDVVPTGSSLKAHLMSGDLIVLDQWSQTDSSVTGSGTRYGPDRGAGVSGVYTLQRDSVALLETSRSSFSRAGVSIGFMAAYTTLSAFVTVVCLANPKSCFGSCPTFYVEGSDGDVPQAEGFSASIARALEARDVDALGDARPRNGRLRIQMKNEAFETHAVRSLRLLAAQRPAGGRVFRGVDGAYYRAPGEVVPPLRCDGPEGDCRIALNRLDRVERQSLADSSDLAATEVVELEFPPLDGPAGVVLAARQSLVSTYLFYETMAYLGRGAGEWLAALERGGPEVAGRAMGLAQALGGVEVELQGPHGDWVSVGTYDEVGPIATDVVVIPFEARGDGPIRARLRMAKGAWRINWAGVVRLDGPVVPTVIEPALVERAGQLDSTALARLRHPDRYLVTTAGDEYRISFDVPGDLTDPELFLESRGYYYEWMREEWLGEENPAMTALAFTDPHEALRRMAPGFKKTEPGMERLFWQSRFAR